MPRDDYDAFDWSRTELDLFVDAVYDGSEPEVLADMHLRELFDDALFDMDLSKQDRDDAYDELVDYLWNEYGIDFEENFDWEGYREWYDSAA